MTNTPSPSLYVQKQIEYEKEYLDHAAVEARLDAVMRADKGRGHTIGSAQPVLARAIYSASSLIDDIDKDPRVKAEAAACIGLLQSKVAAYLCVTDVFDAIMGRDKQSLRTVCYNIGASFMGHINATLLGAEKPETLRALKPSLERWRANRKMDRYKASRFNRWISSKLDAPIEARAVQYQVGAALVHVAIASLTAELPGLCRIRKKWIGRYKHQKYLVADPHLVGQFMSTEANRARASFAKPPVLECDPAPWTSMNSGGYHYAKIPFMTRCTQKHREHFNVDLPVTRMECADRLGRTRLKINQFILGVAKEISASPSMGLPDIMYPPAPGKGASDEVKRLHRVDMAEITKVNKQRRAQRRSRSLTLADAERVNDIAGDSYFTNPHFIDYRSRYYPVCRRLSPTGGDFSRALLQFVEEIGTSTTAPVYEYAAAAYGRTGEREALREWTANHYSDITIAAMEPTGRGYEFWSQAKEPWCFLAACSAIVRGEIDVLPIWQDQHASAFEHMALLTRNSELAEYLNLIERKMPADIYTSVNAALGHVDGVTLERSEAKTLLVSLGFGAAPRNAADDLSMVMRDRLGGGNWTAQTKVFANRASEWLNTVCRYGTLRSWLAKVGTNISKTGSPPSWLMHDGFRVIIDSARYHLNKTRLCNTPLGEYHIPSDHPSDQIRTLHRRVGNGMLANLIQSYDATVLTTFVRSVDYPVLTAHDAVAVHAAHVEAARARWSNSMRFVHQENPLHGIVDMLGDQYVGKPPALDVMGDMKLRELPHEYALV